MNKPDWERKPPSRPGIWLRYNAGHQVNRHTVLRLDGVLKIDWGGEGTLMKVKGNQRLEGWLWYGPIPKPRGIAYKPKEVT